jgi:hypothetical protein
VFALAGTAHADVIFTVGNVPQIDENILFNGEGLVSSGNPVTGVTNQTNITFAFGSNETLTTQSSGQARIAAVNSPFNLFTIEGEPNTLFESAIFNLNAAASGTVTILVTNQFGQVESQSFTVGSSGSNFFTLTTNDVQSIRSIAISGANLNDVRQIRIGGASTLTTESGFTSTSVPEPSTMALMSAACLALCIAARSRRAKPVKSSAARS